MCTSQVLLWGRPWKSLLPGKDAGSAAGTVFSPGLKVAATCSISGFVVGEWLGSPEGTWLLPQVNKQSEQLPAVDKVTSQCHCVKVVVYPVKIWLWTGWVGWSLWCLCLMRIRDLKLPAAGRQTILINRETDRKWGNVMKNLGKSQVLFLWVAALAASLSSGAPRCLTITINSWPAGKSAAKTV